MIEHMPGETRQKDGLETEIKEGYGREINVTDFVLVSRVSYVWGIVFCLLVVWAIMV